MIINIILYIFIGIGVSYFVYFFYKKWPEFRKQDLPSENLISENVRIYPKKLFAFLKKQQLRQKAQNLFWRIRRKKPLAEQSIDSSIDQETLKPTTAKHLNVKKILGFAKIVGKKIASLIKQFVKGVKVVYRKSKSMAKFLKAAILKIKFPKVKLPKLNLKLGKISEVKMPFFRKQELGEEKKEEKVEIPEEKPQDIIEKPKVKKLPKISFKKVQAFAVDKQRKISLFIKEKQLGAKLSKSFSGIKAGAKKISFKKGLHSLKKIQAGLKARFKSEEDERIKKHLQEKKDSIIEPESYLGELLKKTEDSKTNIEFKTVALPEEEKEEEHKFLAQIEEKIEIPETVGAKEEHKPQSIEVSKETIRKIEDRLIHEIMQDPKNIEAYKKLGKLYYHQFKYAYAKECFETALKLGSGDKKIQRLLKKCEEKIRARQNKM